MPTVTEMGAVEAYIVTKCTADSALKAAAPGGIHWGVGPDDAQTPFLVYFLASGVDVKSQGKIQVYSDCVYTIKDVAEAKKRAQLETILLRLTALFNSVDSDANADYLKMYRADLVSYPETIDAKLWQHHGARFAFGPQLH